MCYSNSTIVNIYWHCRKLVYKIIVNRGGYKINYLVAGYRVYSPYIYTGYKINYLVAGYIYIYIYIYEGGTRATGSHLRGESTTHFLGLLLLSRLACFCFSCQSFRVSGLELSATLDFKSDIKNLYVHNLKHYAQNLRNKILCSRVAWLWSNDRYLCQMTHSDTGRTNSRSMVHDISKKNAHVKVWACGYRLTSLGGWKCIFKVQGPTWHMLTSLLSFFLSQWW
jgi:hypothetical protein